MGCCKQQHPITDMPMLMLQTLHRITWSATPASSIDTLSEAARWFVKLESADRLDDVWRDFDNWFQASAAHRAAYVQVRKAWHRLAGAPSALPLGDNPATQSRLHWAIDHLLTCGCEWLSSWWPLLCAVALLTIIYSIDVGDCPAVVFLK